jgi:hypothetical protein
MVDDSKKKGGVGHIPCLRQRKQDSDENPNLPF